MRVELISVGTEIVIGDIVNTNIAYLSKELATMGIAVYKHTSVGDNEERFLKVLDDAFSEQDTVIITGGLGPTDDDITKEAVAKYFNSEMYFSKEEWQKIVDKLTKNKTEEKIADNNKKQVTFPDGAKLLENHAGIAPGIILEKDGKRAILLPGPPREMKVMFETGVKKYLEKFTDQVFRSKYVRFYGIGESLLEEKIKNILDEQTNPTLALYAKNGEVMLRLTASCESSELCEKILEEKISQIKEIVGQYIYLIGDETISHTQTELNSVVVKKLLDNNITISIAESITGGMIASSLIEKSGVSNSLLEAVVCYSNKSKNKTLGVDEKLLEEKGAVSKEVAEQMALGVKNRLNSDIAVATTGYAGPTDEVDGSNVGLVYIAVANGEKVSVTKHHFTGDRQYIRFRVMSQALYEIYKVLQEIEKN